MVSIIWSCQEIERNPLIWNPQSAPTMHPTTDEVSSLFMFCDTRFKKQTIVYFLLENRLEILPKQVKTAGVVFVTVDLGGHRQVAILSL